MTIARDLDECQEYVSTVTLNNVLSSTVSLTSALRKMKKSKDVLPYLRHELLHANRLSYINRMYGRYHTLLRLEATEEMHKCRKVPHKAGTTIGWLLQKVHFPW